MFLACSRCFYWSKNHKSCFTMCLSAPQCGADGHHWDTQKLKTNVLYLRLRKEGGRQYQGRVNVAESLALIFFRECKSAKGKFRHLKRKFWIERLLRAEGRKAEQGPGLPQSGSQLFKAKRARDGRDAHEEGETLNQFAIESGKRHQGRKPGMGMQSKRATTRSVLFLVFMKLCFYLVKENGVNSSLPSGKDEGKLEPFSFSTPLLYLTFQHSDYILVNSEMRTSLPTTQMPSHKIVKI